MHSTEKFLLHGGIVECANIEGSCASEIKQGDHYFISEDYMYCCKECAEESERLKRGRS